MLFPSCHFLLPIIIFEFLRKYSISECYIHGSKKSLSLSKLIKRKKTNKLCVDFYLYHQVSTVFIHPQFDHFSYTSDVAILQFSIPVSFSQRIAPICLWRPEDIAGRVGLVR